jgi:cell division protein FtsI (penicillin-binding protein 3)
VSDNKKGILHTSLKKLELSIYKKILTIVFFIVLGYGVIIFKLIEVSISKNGFVEKRPVLFISNNALNNRAAIVDRNGALLAANLKTVSLFAKPHLIKEPQLVAQQLKKIFPKLDMLQLINDFKSSKKFVWIKRNLTPKEQFAVNNLGIPALEFQESSKRVYPNGNLLSHLVGYVGVDRDGLAGIERYFDKVLFETGKTQDHLETSIDLTVQTIAHEELAKGMASVGAEAGTVIIMNVKNGEIIALVSLPDFNPHNPGQAKPEALFNRATLGLYEMGSVMKPLTFAMALEEKVSDVNYIYEVDSPIKAAQFRIHDYKGGKGGWLSFAEIFMYSSNIGTAKIAKEVGKANQIKWLKNIGMLDKLSLEISEKSSPIYPSYDKWGEISMFTISFGHGIAVTPLHIVKATAALVNGGYKVEPTILKRPVDYQANRIFDEATSDKMRRLYRLNVEYGTGQQAEVAGYFVGGKTGSTDKVYQGSYNAKGGTVASFIGSFPMDDPQYAILVMVEDSKTATATGGKIAAPVAGSIISQIAPVVNVKPCPEDDPKIKEKLYLQYHYQINHLDSL